MTYDHDLAMLRTLNKRFIHNFVTNDVSSHDAMLHPLFCEIGSQGNCQNRASYLLEWATGFDPAVITYWDMRDEHISIVKDVAWVRATTKWIRFSDGSSQTGMTCYTDIYVRHEGQWLCVQAQLTPVAPKHYPPDSSIVCCYVKGVLQRGSA